MSNPPRKHHFLPMFYQRAWTGSDGKLERFSIEHVGQVHRRRVTPSQAGFESDLYRLPGEQNDVAAQLLESKFFGSIDNAASNVLSSMLATRKTPTTSEGRTAWATFMLSLLHRTPEHLAATLEAVRLQSAELMPDMEAKYSDLRAPTDPPTFAQWQEISAPLAVTLSGYRVMQSVIINPPFGHFLVNTRWDILDLKEADYPLLTSDNPIVLVPLKRDNGHIAVPISPHLLFVAAGNQRFLTSLRSVPSKAIVRSINRLTVERATRLVIAKDGKQEVFIRKYFGTSRIGSFATGFVKQQRT